MIHLVTDSTSDLTREAAAELGVRVVPLTVTIGGSEYRDGVDLTPDEFYRQLGASAELPRTSQPAPQEFESVYSDLLRDEGDTVVSVHIATQLSGTLQSASLAARSFPEGRVHVVDSGTVSAGIQMLLHGAVDDARDGRSGAEVASRLRERRERLGLYVVFDTLTYLHRGGRIGRAQAFVGGVLSLKPVLRLAGGEISPVCRVRSRQQGIARLLELLRQEGRLERAAIMHTDVPAVAAEAAGVLGTEHAGVPLLHGQMGPVIGTYAGPGCVGVGYLRAAAVAPN